ncbi:MAG TPA: YfbR-like 5'-deoxynucleotidase, partial [Blastocatellia bacterium]|nr:YfbR-like 5'-deoxynucleotidase [Blastocatellia bacterium]
PDALKEDYRALFIADNADRESWELVKAADKLCAYIKCLEEIRAGNQEFAKAELAIRAAIEALNLPEAQYFLDTFAPSFKLTLDELD